MAIVATSDGGLVPCPGGLHQTDDGKAAVLALSREQVHEVARGFRALNPYDPAAVPGSILEIEDINNDPATGKPRQLYTYAISAKRYALYTISDGAPRLAAIAGEQSAEEDDSGGSEGLLGVERTRESNPPPIDPDLVEAKQHGLGHLLNPTNPEDESREWISQWWEHIIRTAHGLRTTKLTWLDRPAITRITISKPRFLCPFKPAKARRKKASAARRSHAKPLPQRPYQQIRPFNFLLTAHIDPIDRPPGADPNHFQLVAPYNRDARQWRKLRWIDAATREPYKITTTGPPGEGEALVKTYAGTLAEYRVHPEPKSLGPDGQPCDKETHGLLARRHITLAGHIRHIGKESNKLEDREAGLALDPDETLTNYNNPDQDDYKTLVAPVLRDLPVAETAKATGISERTIKRARAGAGAPHPGNRATLTAYAARFAREQLRAAGIEPPVDDYAALAACLAQRR